jgi:predicted HicB family RNase H-like nuclease
LAEKKKPAVAGVATVRIATELRDRAKVQAAREKRKIQALLDQAVEDYLKAKRA